MPTPEELIAEAQRLETEAAAQLAEQQQSSNAQPTPDPTPEPSTTPASKLAAFLEQLGLGGAPDNVIVAALDNLLSDKASAEITDRALQLEIEEFMRANNSSITYTWKAF